MPLRNGSVTSAQQLRRDIAMAKLLAKRRGIEKPMLLASEELDDKVVERD
jgi:hypothetical protein